MQSRVLFILFTFFFLGLKAQKYATSPFSARGFGETENLYNASFSGLGNAYVAMIDSTTLNYLNPSSYAFLGEGQPVFSAGISTQSSVYTEGDTKSKNGFVALNHFAFGLSFGKYFGFSAGLKPYASTGYDVKKTVIYGLDTLTNLYNGSGNFSNAFLGFSIKLLNHKKHVVSIGINEGYVFGTNLNKQSSYLSSEIIGGVRQQTLKIKDFIPEYGVTYCYLPSKAHSIYLSGVYNPSTSVKSEYKSSLISAQDITNSNSFDTLNFISKSGSYTSPSIIQLGFKYDFININNPFRTSPRVAQLQLLGSFKYTYWSQYTANYSNSDVLANTINYSLGLQFSPHYDFLDRSKSISYISKLKYRVGFQYNTLPWSSDLKQYLNRSFTFGVGIPIISQRSLSSVNIACILGKRGNNTLSSVDENYVSFNIGIVIAPAIYDRWFRKGKID